MIFSSITTNVFDTPVSNMSHKVCVLRSNRGVRKVSIETWLFFYDGLPYLDDHHDDHGDHLESCCDEIWHQLVPPLCLKTKLHLLMIIMILMMTLIIILMMVLMMSNIMILTAILMVSLMMILIKTIITKKPLDSEGQRPLQKSPLTSDRSVPFAQGTPQPVVAIYIW